MRQPRARLPLRTQSALSVNPTPVRFTLIRPQSGLSKAKPLNMHNKKLTPGRSLGPNETLGVRFWQANTGPDSVRRRGLVKTVKTGCFGALQRGAARAIWGTTTRPMTSHPDKDRFP